MLRAFRIASLVLVVMTVSSRPAKADIWDWFADLSGAGPFGTRGNLTATIYCHDAGWLRLPDDSKPSGGPCIFADVRRFKSEEDERYFPVRMEVYESGPTFRLAPPIELGFGVGVIHFSSDGVTADRLTLSFPRLVFKPLLLLPQLQKNPNWGFFQAYFRENRIIGNLTQDDFRPKPGVTFRAEDDFVASTGFMIDVVALVRLIKK